MSAEPNLSLLNRGWTGSDSCSRVHAEGYKYRNTSAKCNVISAAQDVNGELRVYYTNQALGMAKIKLTVDSSNCTVVL